MNEFVPLIQTLLWVLLIAGALVFFRSGLERMFRAVESHVRQGGGVEVGAAQFLHFKVVERLRELPRLEPHVESRPPGDAAEASSVREWTERRKQIAQESRRVHLAHVIKPSEIIGQRFDIYVFLVAGKHGDLSQVKRAEFFLGKYWGNRVFEARPNAAGEIGFSTSAYGPALCVCRVEFRDGHEAVLSRFLDFEAAERLTATLEA